MRKFRFWNTTRRGRRVRSEAIARTALLLSLDEKAAETRLSNGAHCVFIPLPMDPRDPAIRAMEGPLGSVQTVGLKADASSEMSVCASRHDPVRRGIAMPAATSDCARN